MRYSMISALAAAGIWLFSAGCGNQATAPIPPSEPQSSASQELAQLVAPSGVPADTWQDLKKELERVLAITGARRDAASAPTDELSKVPALTVAPGVGSTAIFSFDFRCSGDYDQNGEVNIADLTPVGVHFGKTAAVTDWAAARVADGDANGEINIADITPIGQYFMVRVTGYQLEMADSAAGPNWVAVAEIALPSGAVPPAGGYRHFDFALAGPVSGKYYRVVPFDQAATRLLGIASEPVLYSADMLPAPGNVQASDGIYTDRITVTWDKVSGATAYAIYRDSQAAALAQVGDVNLYDDTALADTAAHSYWIKAGDGARESNFSAADAGYQGAGSGGLEPPAGVAASDGVYTDHVLLTWTKAVNATGYEIYRDSQAAPLDTVGDLAAYNDYSVGDVFQHTYWLKSVAAADASGFSISDTGYRAAPPTNTMVVLAWNDLGMHCMNEDFSELMILPPYNTLHAQVINRVHGSPEIVTAGVTVRYTIPENTHSADKTNFWEWADELLGATLAPNIGLTGHGMAGVLAPLQLTEGRNDWNVTGIPITPINDAGVEDPYNLTVVTVENGSSLLARTEAVVPVSWEISCNLCHTATGKSVASDILDKHDALHGTTLAAQKPVLCGGCHGQPPLGLAGLPGIPTLSSAVHSAHAPRMAQAGLAVDCYACHPGQRTQCLRDVMFAAGVSCADCHGDMAAVGNPARGPWGDEPRCGNCHAVAGHEYEQPATLYRNSIGHNGIHCAACHGSPHAITPTVVEDDNRQAILAQGHSGKIDTCSVCHSVTPDDPFNHDVGEWTPGGED